MMAYHVRYHDDVGARPTAARMEPFDTFGAAKAAADRFNSEHRFLDYGWAEVLINGVPVARGRD